MVQLVQGTVDTQKNICRSLGRANAGDDLKLELEIQMNGKPITFVNPTCELLIKKTDNNKVRQTKDIIYQDGKFKIKVDQQGVTCPGTVINQLVINDEGRVSTCLFYFTVGASLEKEILQSISKVETLEQLDSYVVAAFSNLDEYEKRLTLLDSTMTTTNEEITANESERKSNESERKDNETLRIENEKERVKKENEMSAAEIDRKENELDRIKNENARRIAENTRIARENARENAEINRNAIFEENETIRNEAEKLREKAETKRKENFNNLETLNEKLNEAEKERKEAEEDRISKETERQLAEAERERAEANREKTYTRFNDAEVDRKNSEDARIQAEASRVQAESVRVERFETAQSARETKFQESENNRDKLFKTNETARATEEIARKKAESTREGNETIRVNSESLRVASEKARQQEEIKRGQAEVARVEAEKVRELSYEAIKKDNSTFKQQMNEGFGNAKTDYFGKEHINIVDRLTNDFDNVHQRINDSNYLEYEGSNIQADNSYYGYTKEMSIKGKTLQNLLKSNPDNKVISSTTHSGYMRTSFNLFNKKYSFIFDITTFNSDGAYLFLRGQGNNTPFGEYSRKYITSTGKYVLTVDLSGGKDCFQFLCGFNGSGNCTIDNILLLEGDYTNTPIELPLIEGIKSVGENDVTEEGEYPVKIKSCGKNLFDFSQFKKNIEAIKGLKGVTFEENKVIFEPSSTSINGVFSETHFKENTQYSLSYEFENDASVTTRFFKIEYTDGTASQIYPTGKQRVTHTSLKGKTIKHIVLSYGTTSYKVVFSNIQLEEGTIATNYEPYQESVQEILLDEPLRSLPNGVCDEITKDGKLIRRIGKIVLNGSENWYTAIALDNTKKYFIANNLIDDVKQIINSKFDDQISNTLSIDNPYIYPTQSCVWALWQDQVSRIRISIKDVTNIKAWLKENPTTLYYELETPTITKYNKKMILKTYDRTTHIASTNSLPATISCKVPSNVQAVISNLKEENEALNTKVSTLNLENEEIKETNIIQDELINTTMMATDEMYMMLEPLLAETLGERSVSKMVDMYVAMVQRGIKTIDQVPVRYREQVKKILDQLEK